MNNEGGWIQSFEHEVSAWVKREIEEQVRELRELDVLHRLSVLERQVKALRKTLTKEEGEIMATQADLDALAQSVNDDVAKINDEITALQNANPNLDLSGLQAAVAGLDSTANGGAAPAPGGDTPAS